MQLCKWWKTKKWKSRREWVGKMRESIASKKKKKDARIHGEIGLARKKCFYFYFFIFYLIYYLNFWDKNLKNKFQSPNFLKRKPQQNISSTFSFCFFVLSWLIDIPFKKNCFSCPTSHVRISILPSHLSVHRNLHSPS